MQFKVSLHNLYTCMITHWYLASPNRETKSNSIDPDEKPLKVASHQGLHCLPLQLKYLFKNDLFDNSVNGERTIPM